MTQEPVDKYFGIPMSEWIERIPNELELDAVGLWQIIPVGADGFGLSGERLDDFGYRCILALLRRGAAPVKSKPNAVGWAPATEYTGTHEEVARQIIDDWRAGRLVPDHDGLSFSIF
ncbi:hypothetical protein [Trinickia dabaoshanensis]|uniref:hypothetical protein n=1 Tax=Trinickia dabaoshanensis TaxID=564714 RepID=UPI0018EE0280|nr:hypothetical protein [Trinickia dabaoshanensis]